MDGKVAVDGKLGMGYCPGMPTRLESLEFFKRAIDEGVYELRPGAGPGGTGAGGTGAGPEVWMLKDTPFNKEFRRDRLVNGYPTLREMYGGVVYQVQVAKLVWYLHYGKEPAGRLRYKDGDPKNAAIGNLELAREFRARLKLKLTVVRNGRLGRPRGLSDDEIRLIRFYRGQLKQTAVAEMFGISQVMVSAIQTRRKYADVADDPDHPLDQPGLGLRELWA